MIRMRMCSVVDQDLLMDGTTRSSGCQVGDIGQSVVSQPVSQSSIQRRWLMACATRTVHKTIVDRITSWYTRFDAYCQATIKLANEIGWYWTRWNGEVKWIEWQVPNQLYYIIITKQANAMQKRSRGCSIVRPLFLSFSSWVDLPSCTLSVFLFLNHEASTTTLWIRLRCRNR